MDQGQGNLVQHRDNVDQHQDNVDQFQGNVNQQRGNVLVSKRLSWSLIFQIATLLFLAGIAYASFQTKNDAAAETKAALEFNVKTYMTRELSMERWSNNDVRLQSIEKKIGEVDKKLDDILREVRRQK